MIINLFFALSLSICCNHSIQMKANNNEQKCVFLGAHEKFGYDPLTSSDIPDALDACSFDSTGGSKWTKVTSFSVADVNGGEPNDIVNYAYDAYNVKTIAPGPFSEARNELLGDGTKYVGCGINALYSELEYFSLYGHFDWLGVDDNDNEDYKGLAKYIIQNTDTITLGENIFTSHSSMCSSFNSAMAHFGYNNILSLQAGLGSQATFIDSINEGYPIIWGCALDGEIAKAHYLVVYGYERWACVDASGNPHYQIMFKTRYNWFYNLTTGPVDYYIHPDMFNYINVAFYPHRVRNHYIFKDNAITNSCSYPSSPVSHSIPMPNGYVTGTHLRTGYVVDSIGDHFLTMSARRNGAGVAQIVLNFPETISEIYWKYAFWSASEKFNFSTDSFALEGKTYDSGPWILIDNLPLYLITTHRDRPDRYHKLFNDGYISVRITLTTSAVGDRNKGRVTFRDIMAFGNYYAS